MREFRVALLWGAVLLCIFLVISSAVWLFATPVETCTLTTSGGAVQETCDNHYGELVIPGVLLAVGLAALIAFGIGLRGALREAGYTGDAPR